MVIPNVKIMSVVVLLKISVKFNVDIKLDGVNVIKQKKISN